jgi:hypothetical protein
MEIKFKVKDGKELLVARDDIQAAAFEKAGFEPATKEEAAKLAKIRNPKEKE